MQNARIFCLIFICLNAWSCSGIQSSSSSVQKSAIKYDGVPGYVVGHCFWVDGNMMPIVGGTRNFRYTPLVGASVDFYSRDTDDEGTKIPVKSTFSDEAGLCEVYLPPGKYVMCAVWGKKSGRSFEFLVQAGEAIDVDVRVKRHVVD